MKGFVFNKKNLHKAVEAIQKRIKVGITPESCSVCSVAAKGHYHDIVKFEGSWPEEISKLEKVLYINAHKDAVMQCPECGRVYRYAYSYEYLVGGSEEGEEIRPITAKEILPEIKSILRAYVPPKIIRHIGNAWEIDF